MSTDQEVFFKPSKYVDIPTSDVLSWIFDEPSYPEDEPVSVDQCGNGFELTMLRYTLMLKTRDDH